MNKVVSAKINITPKLPISGIYYIGQYGTSGYASAARGYLYHYFTNGFKVTWDPLYFDNSKLDNNNVYDVIIKSLINKNISSYDTVIMHSTPDLWPQFWRDKQSILKNKIVIGYCTWETDSLPKKWVDCINQSSNEVWCPSVYNETTFKKSGINIPIRVVPHVFLHQNLPLRENIVLLNSDDNTPITFNPNLYTFYSIGELNIRKGIEDTITSFCKAFSKLDPVQLIIKVHYKDYTGNNKLLCNNIIQSILDNYPDHANIICLFDNISNDELLALHSIGDCYVSLTKAEGFGLTIFDAFNYGKKIIATGYSGHLDFLGKNYSGLVDYTLGPVTGMNSFSEYYTEEQKWAYPDMDHAITLMRNLIK